MIIRSLIVRSAIIATLMIGFAGCTEFGEKQITDQTKISQIQRGVSTKDSIKSAFGQPEGIDYAANGGETWTYSYANAHANPAMFVPIIGMLATTVTARSSILVVQFDSRGIVRSYTVHNSESKA